MSFNVPFIHGPQTLSMSRICDLRSVFIYDFYLSIPKTLCAKDSYFSYHRGIVIAVE